VSLQAPPLWMLTFASWLDKAVVPEPIKYRGSRRSILSISPVLSTASPRLRCHPTSSIGNPERNTIRAASGSTRVLYSAACATFPSQHALPPITTHRLTLVAILGSCFNASASW
jgi:hypothetical protein